MPQAYSRCLAVKITDVVHFQPGFAANPKNRFRVEQVLAVTLAPLGTTFSMKVANLAFHAPSVTRDRHFPGQLVSRNVLGKPACPVPTAQSFGGKTIKNKDSF